VIELLQTSLYDLRFTSLLDSTNQSLRFAICDPIITFFGLYDLRFRYIYDSRFAITSYDGSDPVVVTWCRNWEYPQIENCCILMEEVSWLSCKVHFPDGGSARGEVAIVGLQRNFIGFSVLWWGLNDWEVSHDRLNVKEVISLTRTWSKTLGNWPIALKIVLGLQNLEKYEKFRVW
jgi:hypothetical protein